MRIMPLESRNPFLRLLGWVTRRIFGRELTPYQVIFSRLPRALPGHIGILLGLVGRQAIEPELRLLVQAHVAGLNGCAFCLDIGRAMATYEGLALDKLDAVGSWRTSALFDARERAALAYVEEATRTRRVSDETFAALRAQFDDRQIVALTWLCAVENYFNLLNGPLEIGSDGLCAIAEQRVARRGRRARDAAASAA